MRAFADALDAVPLALSENSGLSPIETLASIKSRQVKEKNTRLGVDCMNTGSNGKSLPPRGLECTLANSYKLLRHEGALCHRSSDRKAPTASSCYPALPHGSQGKLD